MDQQQQKADVKEGSLQKSSSTIQVQSNNVTITKEDATLIADECEITIVAAEYLLRKNDGNIQKALTSFITGET